MRALCAHEAYSRVLFVDDINFVICYGCPETLENDVTWCVHIFDPVDDVKICINVTGVVNETVAAAELKINEVLYWQKVEY